jgi:hypothetical protein
MITVVQYLKIFAYFVYFFGFFSNSLLHPSQQKKNILLLCSKVVASSLSNSIPHTGSIGTSKKKITGYLLFASIGIASII